jgi:energy-coupling factor transporter ATP-binding protein EcfA2
MAFEIKLNDDLTFLNGINGSGKTTIVNCIVSLITPDLGWLLATDFRRIAVGIDVDGSEIVIDAKKSANTFTLHCTSVAESLKLPLKLMESRAVPRRVVTSSGRVIWRRRLDQIIPRKAEEHKVVSFIENLPTPMFLGLERTTRRIPFYEEVDPDEIDEGPRNVFRGSLDESLREAAEIAREAYQDLRRQQELSTSDLRKRLILSAFRYHEERADFPSQFPSRSALRQIDRNRADVEAVLLQLGIGQEEITQTVRPFFIELKDIIKELPAGKAVGEAISKRDGITEPILRWFQIRPQEARVNQIVSFIDSYNEELRKLYEGVDRYRALTNRFINDSRKSIVFAPDEKLVVELPNGDIAPLASLSSGERQIVVILTHLAFNERARQANVLIIDEPEISLHVRWQEIFVDALRDANPSTQVILATHSPSIILDRAEKCVDL